jgi:hypothetical protein
MSEDLIYENIRPLLPRLVINESIRRRLKSQAPDGPERMPQHHDCVVKINKKFLQCMRGEKEWRNRMNNGKLCQSNAECFHSSDDVLLYYLSELAAVVSGCGIINISLLPHCLQLNHVLKALA